MELTLEKLQAEIQELRDIEAIKTLKGKYLRCLDSKLWDEISTCFTEDVTTSYSDGKLSFTGRKDVTDYFRGNMPASMITTHQCHTPEIEMTSTTTATAVWYLQDYLILQEYDKGIQGTAFYTETYEKVGKEWLIKTIGYKRVFEERWDRNDPTRKVLIDMHK